MTGVDWARAAAAWLSEFAQFGILLTDQDLRIRMWNRWLETHSGYSAADVIGQPLLELYPELSERGVDRYYRDALAGQVQVLSHRFHRYLLPLPSLFSTEAGLMTQSAQIAPLVQDDRVIGTITVVEDVTERVEREQTLLRSNRDLEAALEELSATQRRVIEQERMGAVGQLAAGIAHDFNSILGGILLATEVIMFQPDLPRNVRENLARIHDASQQAAKLVRQILDFSRKSLRQLQPFDLGALLREWVNAQKHTLAPTINVHCQIAPGDYTIQADLAQMRQILANLTENARDAMPGGGDLIFRLSRLVAQPDQPGPMPDIQPGRWLALSIQDTGVGIPADLLPRVFEPFFTTKEVGNGTGLGLSQAYGIVMQHGGHVAVDSQVGQGTTIRIYLPADGTRAEQAVETAPESRHEATQAVLLVEEDMTLLEVMRMVLDDLGFSVLTAETGKRALDIWREYGREISLIVLDVIVLGDEPGAFEAIAKTNQSEACPVPVVIVSDHSWTQQGIEPHGLRIAGWLRKPFSDQEMAATIQEALERVQGAPPRAGKGQT